MKRLIIGAVFVVTAFSGLVAQEQFVTVAVFNIDRVITAYYQDSSTIRRYQDAQQEYEAEMERLDDQLLDYQRRRADALEDGDSRTARRLADDIEALEDDIATRRDAWLARQERLRQELSDDVFYDRLYRTVEFVAENGGYTGVLEETAMGTALFWISPAIDITREIIDEMRARY
ncbi:MAG: OmpH family outer membrane protein [Spirochaetales bacterium]